MTDIFLSYAEQDRDKARQVAEALGAVGWDVWWDRRIPAGKTWREVLDAQLKSMRCMVVLWSRRSVASDWVCEEAAEGRRLRKLVPVLIDAVQPPVGFRELQAADLAGWNGSNTFVPLRELLLDIERLIGKPLAAAPTPAEPNMGERASKKVPWAAGAAVGLTVVVAALAVVPRLAGLSQQTADAGVQGRPEPSAPPPPRSDIRSPSVPSGGASSAPQAVKLSAAAIKEKCDRLKERMALGETLLEESLSFFRKECAR